MCWIHHHAGKHPFSSFSQVLLAFLVLFCPLLDSFIVPFSKDLLIYVLFCG